MGATRKIWKPRGFSRSQQETAKIAKLNVLDIKPTLLPAAVIEIVLHFCRYARYVQDRGFRNSDIIAAAVKDAPFFRLDQLLAEVERFGGTSLRDETMWEINDQLTNRKYGQVPSHQLMPEAEEIYFRSREEFLADISAQYPNLS